MEIIWEFIEIIFGVFLTYGVFFFAIIVIILSFLRKKKDNEKVVDENEQLSLEIQRNLKELNNLEKILNSKRKKENYTNLEKKRSQQASISNLKSIYLQKTIEKKKNIQYAEKNLVIEEMPKSNPKVVKMGNKLFRNKSKLFRDKNELKKAFILNELLKTKI